jgi:predicted alpha/beta-hydrolase family hydrolase
VGDPDLSAGARPHAIVLDGDGDGDGDGGERVSALLVRQPDARWLYVLAHGAGAGMRHVFMDQIAAALAAQRIATLRYQFPFMEAGRPRTDPPATCARTVRAAVAAAERLAPDLPRIAGGKSFGGRMTSQAAAAGELPGVRALVFLGFPLHPAGKPATERADHLASVTLPMLFVQGDRDQLATPRLLRRVLKKLPGATLAVVDGADHAFAVAKTRRRDVPAELAARIAAYLAAI